MANTIFFSWQADTQTLSSRNLIERALERAISRIEKDASVEQAVRELEVDRDTKDVAGSPPIVDTIFKKIDQAAVFVADLTFIGKRLDGRPTPNPNVLIEYGWALKSLGYSRIVPVMNTAFGEPTADSMPFNLGHLRRPITYHCADAAGENDRRQTREQLADHLQAAIRLVLESEDYQKSLPVAPHYEPVHPVNGEARFTPKGEPIGVVPGGVNRSPQKVYVSSAPACWFRMMPTIDPRREWTNPDIHNAMTSRVVVGPLNRDWPGYTVVRSEDGLGLFHGSEDEKRKITLAAALVFGFGRGEIWTIDTYWLKACRNDKGQPTMPDVEPSFRRALTDYGRFLSGLGIDPPYRWIAGMENLKDRLLYVPQQRGYGRISNSANGVCMRDVIIASGNYSPGDPEGATLKPFFSKLYEACGISRQDWQDA
jgi:hypothetical protein